MRKSPRMIAVLVATMVVTMMGTQAVLAASVTNGTFETWDFTGWTVMNSSSGGWFVYTDTAAPISGLPVAAPPEGIFAATTDQNGPGSGILYQDLQLESACTHTLSFILFYQNDSSEGFFTAPSLSYLGDPNQQYRVDIMDPAASVDSVADTDVLAPIFQTHVGDPLSQAPTSMSVDLSAFAGSTVRLRFAEVNNMGFFRASVDDVRVENDCGPEVPEVHIDIKPGSAPNSINCKNERGVIPVAILTTDNFDATTVDHTTVTFEGARETHVSNQTGEPQRHEEDVDGDGDMDLVFHFRFEDTSLTCASTQGTLRGLTFDGQEIEGVDSVRMVYRNGD